MFKAQAKAPKKASSKTSTTSTQKHSSQNKIQKKKSIKSTKSLLTTQKRNKLSVGKVQKASRAESMAQNKLVRATALEEENEAKAAAKAALVEVVELPAVALEKKKRALISLLDVPRTLGKKQSEILGQLADANLPWTPIEVGQILALASNGHATNYKAGARLVQNIVDGDYLPYKSALRGLMRLFECAHHYKGAEATAAQFKNIYPVTEFDEVGMPKTKTVLTTPVPNFLQLAELPTSPESIEDIRAFEKTCIESGQQLPLRWATEHHLLRQLIKNNKKDEASKQLFRLFNRLGAAPTPNVPGKFDPIPFGTIFPKPAAAAQFKPEFPLYYQAIDDLTASGNWAAAMTAAIYTRTLNRVIDVTPVRERTQNGQWRDYLDIHTHDGYTARLVVRHFLKELAIRRGYRSEMEANVKGSEDAVTFSEFTRENALGYSPIINTESEDLIFLTDRNYQAQDVIQGKGGFQFTTAHHIIETFEQHGIKASLSYGGKLSSSKIFYNHYTGADEADNTDGTTSDATAASATTKTTPIGRPNAPGKDTPIAFDLVVVVPKEELYAFADRKLKSLPNDVKEMIEKMPIITEIQRGYVKKLYLNERAEANKIIGAAREAEYQKTLIWHNNDEGSEGSENSEGGDEETSEEEKK